MSFEVLFLLFSFTLGHDALFSLLFCNFQWRKSAFWEFSEVCVAGAFPQGMFESFLLRKNLNLNGGNTFFPFMNILICSWTFIDAFYCSTSHSFRCTHCLNFGQRKSLPIGSCAL